MRSLEDDLESIPTTGQVRLAPDPRSLDALGRNHTFEAAVAELIDNSIDAEAKRVSVRFVRTRDRVLRVLVIDDGVGMNSSQIDVAMTVGGSREYGRGQIGRFGLGLKAASLSQARRVTVLSHDGSQAAVGRQWQLDKARHDYTCEIVDPAFASRRLDAGWGLAGSTTGTAVCWDQLTGFPTARSETALDEFIQSAFARIRTHVGMVFHRILAAGVGVRLEIEEDDDIALSVEVHPLDPFGYSRTGAVGWPKTIEAGDCKSGLELRCHIWPGRSTSDDYRLDGNLIERQGLYVYLHDRLIQRGGWNGLCNPDKQLNLARVRIDIVGDVPRMLILKPEKSGVEVGAEFAAAVLGGSGSDGTTFADYIEQARGAFKDANRRRRVRTAILPPGAGFAPRLRRAFEAELPLKDEDPVDIRWTRFDSDDFFEIDREEGVLWLNNDYRKVLSRGRHGGLNDLPVLKALLYLLAENIFSGQNLGPRDKDNIELWQNLLVAAVAEERR